MAVIDWGMRLNAGIHQHWEILRRDRSFWIIRFLEQVEGKQDRTSQWPRPPALQPTARFCSPPAPPLPGHATRGESLSFSRSQFPHHKLSSSQGGNEEFLIINNSLSSTSSPPGTVLGPWDTSTKKQTNVLWHSQG